MLSLVIIFCTYLFIPESCIWQVSGSLYGALIGSALAFTIADFLGLLPELWQYNKIFLPSYLETNPRLYLNEGRRRELLLSAVLYFVGALLTALAPNFPVMVIGRFVYGTGIGLVTQPTFSYLFMFMWFMYTNSIIIDDSLNLGKYLIMWHTQLSCSGFNYFTLEIFYCPLDGEMLSMLIFVFADVCMFSLVQYSIPTNCHHLRCTSTSFS